MIRSITKFVQSSNVMLLSLLILISCRSSQSGGLTLQELEVDIVEMYQSSKSFDWNPKITYEGSSAEVEILSKEFCHLRSEDFSPFMRITPDTIYLSARYSLAGDNRVGTMDLCVYKFTFVLINYQPTMSPLKVEID